jgi:hypothetical protein
LWFVQDPAGSSPKRWGSCVAGERVFIYPIFPVISNFSILPIVIVTTTDKGEKKWEQVCKKSGLAAAYDRYRRARCDKYRQQPAGMGAAEHPSSKKVIFYSKSKGGS